MKTRMKVNTGRQRAIPITIVVLCFITLFGGGSSFGNEVLRAAIENVTAIDDYSLEAIDYSTKILNLYNIEATQKPGSHSAHSE